MLDKESVKLIGKNTINKPCIDTNIKYIMCFWLLKLVTGSKYKPTLYLDSSIFENIFTLSIIIITAYIVVVEERKIKVAKALIIALPEIASM